MKIKLNKNSWRDLKPENEINFQTEAANCAACIVQALKNMDEEVSAQHASTLKKLAKTVAEYAMKAVENPQEVERNQKFGKEPKILKFIF